MINIIILSFSELCLNDYEWLFPDWSVDGICPNSKDERMIVDFVSES